MSLNVARHKLALGNHTRAALSNKRKDPVELRRETSAREFVGHFRRDENYCPVFDPIVGNGQGAIGDQ